MMSNASVGSHFFPRLHLKDMCWDFWVVVSYFFLFPLYTWLLLSNSDKNQLEPSWCLCWYLTIPTCGLHLCLWWLLAKFDTIFRMNAKHSSSLLGELLGVMLSESKWEGWVTLVLVWSVLFLLFSEGIRSIFFLIWSENKILLDLTDKEVFCSIVSK